MLFNSGIGENFFVVWVASLKIIRKLILKIIKRRWSDKAVTNLVPFFL